MPTEAEGKNVRPPPEERSERGREACIRRGKGDKRTKRKGKIRKEESKHYKTELLCIKHKYPNLALGMGSS